MFNKGNYLTKINKHLMLLALGVKSKNKLGLTDDSKLSEDFFKGLLNLVFGYELINLNTEEDNYAGIDLGDRNKKVCIQVTADSSSDKIQHTLNVSDKHNREQEYDTLIVFIVGFKQQRYQKEFDTKISSFSKKDHIWDVNTLLKKTYEIDDINLIKQVVEYLDQQLSTVIKIDPLELSEQDIASVINLLLAYVQEDAEDLLEKSSKKYELVSRDDDFMDEKNSLNSVTQGFFDAEISPVLQYAKDLVNFLGDPINKEHQEKYFKVTESLQSIYSAKADEFDNNLEYFFRFIFGQIVNWENRNHILPQKLLIVLSNMYFNCDIGNNPK